ncbi:MAG TPA: MaoC/PaaZ C-terminal domain-containing protein [Solimonas sp.]
MNIVLNQLPSAQTLYLKAATTLFKRPKGRPVFPALEVRVGQVAVDPQHLAEYRAVCGFAESEHLPITFPHVMAGALHLQMMTSKTFPVPLLGLVHIRNRIEQARPLAADARYDIRVTLGEARDVRQGIEFDFLTDFELDGNVVWHEVSTILYRLPAPKGAGGARPAPTPSPLAAYHAFEAPADIGRRYAGVGRDYNPIHLSPLPAKLFGFKRHIAHGMWSLARCAALLEPTLGVAPRVLDVQFKQPLFLPGRVALKHRRDGSGIEYALLSRNSDKVHLSGTLS